MGVKDMPQAMCDLHDATLLSIDLDWASRRCVLYFGGAPNEALRGKFSIAFEDVTVVTARAEHPWGPSASILEAKFDGPDKYAFVMQSGDEIVVEAKKLPVREVSG